VGRDVSQRGGVPVVSRAAGVRLHPVQLYDAAASLGILVLLLWMVRRGTERHGEIAGTWLFLYGVCRYFVEFSARDAARQPLLSGAVTLAQVMAVAGVILGGVLWLAATTKAEPVEEELERY